MPLSNIEKTAFKRWLWLAVLLVAAVLVWYWLDDDQGQVREPAASQSGPSSSSLWPMAGAALNQAPGQSFIPREPVGEARPADFSPEDWAMLNKALEGQPDRAQERARLVAYLRFQRGVSKWGEMQAGPQVTARQALAKELLDLLPLHVANGEVNVGEAQMMLGALAQDLEPDPVKRAAWVEAQRTRLQQNSQTDAQRKVLDDERRKNEQFAAQQAEIVERWQNSSEASQDPATLEQQLQALREKVYGNGKP